MRTSLGRFLALMILLAASDAGQLLTAADNPAPSGAQVVPQGLRVGAAVAELEADDSMVIAGGITPGKASGQEGKLRAVAIVLDNRTNPNRPSWRATFS